MTLDEIIKQLKEFKHKAETRANTIMEDGRIRDLELRAHDQGCADAYGTSIFWLERFLDE